MSDKADKLTKAPNNFEMFRLERSSEEVGVSRSTIIRWVAEGLRAYRVGKMVFISKSELEAFIRVRSNMTAQIGATVTATIEEPVEPEAEETEEAA